MSRMTFLSTLHLIFVCVWFGVLLVEFLIEIDGKVRRQYEAVTRTHFLIDILFELPIVLGVIVTGSLLIRPFWPPTGLLLVKVICAAIAVFLNLACLVFVILRYRRRAEPGAIERLSVPIHFTILGLPFGVIAFYLGWSLF